MNAAPPGPPPPPPPPDSPPQRPAAPGRAVARAPAPPEFAAQGKLRARLLVAAGGFAVLFGAVALKATDATVVSPRPSRVAVAPRLPAPEPPVSRAPITDRNGEVLAVSVRGTALAARPPQIEDPARVADQLLRILPHLNREWLIQRLSPPRVFAFVDRFITPAQQQAINDLGVVGLYFEQAERRTYPRGRDAAHVLGVVDPDGAGIAGVERWFDERLRVRREPLRLSLDIRVQRELRDALEFTIDRFRGIGGAAVIMDVQTFEVLGMVSLPDFQASDIGHATGDQIFNRALTGVYEPGSTFKLFSAAMALELGTVQMWSGYDASRPIRVGRHEINDFRGQNRWLALPEIIAHSSNLATAHMVAAVGPQRHREFLQRLGMLSLLPIELAEAALPIAPSARNWRDLNTMTIGFGHGLSVSPVHVTMGAAVLANGGVLRPTTILARDPAEPPPEGARIISEQTSERMRRLMRVAVTDGSGRGADAPGYFVGGKTGTAQKILNGRYQENRRISAFVGAFPMNAPRYAFYIMVDEPKPRADTGPFATAGVVAAPAGRRIVERTAPILGLVPEPPERMAAIQNGIGLAMNGRGAPPAPRGAGMPAAPPPAQAAAPQARPAAVAPRPAAPPVAPPAAAAPPGFEAGGPVRRTSAATDADLTGLVHRPLHLSPSPEAGRAAR